jgi:hypothetical protein
MTEYVDSFDTLDLTKWQVTLGKGFRNLYKTEDSKLHFLVTGHTVGTHGEGLLQLMSSSPFSIVNNKFSVRFNIEPRSWGGVRMVFAPKAGHCYALADKDEILFFTRDTLFGVYNDVRVSRVRNGGVQVTITKDLPPSKLGGELVMENVNGVSTFYIDDMLVGSFETDIKEAYVYLIVESGLDECMAGRTILGWLDEFKISDYEKAQTPSQLATLLPTVLSTSQATLALVTTLTMLGIFKHLTEVML